MLAFIDLRVALVAMTCLVASAGLGVLTLWFWRNSRLESPVLAPLEVIGERRFKKAPEDQRDRLLAEVRNLAQAPRNAVEPRASRTVKKPAEDIWDEPLDDEPFEDAVVDDQGPMTVIDPLLGRRGN